MIREEYLRRLLDAAYVDLYLSATDGARCYWPYRMMPTHEADKRHRNACERFVVDSAIQREDLGNEDALDMAHHLDAEMVVLADEWHDLEGTVDAALEGLDLYDDHPFDGDVMIPLQPPHDECYRRLEGQADAYAVGGVKDAPDQERISAARSVRDEAGEDVWIHGLGYGVTEGITRAVHQSPELLDSVDYSTPVQSAMNDPTAPGAEHMSVVAARASAQLVEDARKLTPFTEEKGPTRQAGFSEVLHS